MDFSDDFWLSSLLLLVLTLFGNQRNQMGTGWLLKPWLGLGYWRSVSGGKVNGVRKGSGFLFSLAWGFFWGGVLLTFLFYSTVFWVCFA